MIARLESVFRDVFGDGSLTLDRTTTADDVPGWDSLQHINLIVAIEDEFELLFSAEEATGFANVGELNDLISAKAEST